MKNKLFDKYIKKYLPVLLILIILEILAIITIGYLSVEQDSIFYIYLLGALVIIVIIGILLKNINFSPILLIAFLPIGNMMIFIKPSTYKFSWIRLELIDIAILLVIFCIFFHKCVLKKEATPFRKKLTPEYMIFFLIILVGYALISIVWTPEISMGLNQCVRLAFNFILYLLFIILLKNQEDIIKAIKSIILVSMLIAITMLVSTFPFKKLIPTFPVGNTTKDYQITNELDIHFNFPTYQKKASGSIESHVGAVFLSFGIIFTIGLLYQSKKNKEKFLLFLITNLLFWTILFTEARGPIASMLLAITFLIVTLKNFRKKLFRNLFIFFGCVLLGFVIFSFINLPHINSIKSYFPHDESVRIQSERSLSDRFKYWQTGFNALNVNDAFIQGLGISGSTYYLNPIIHSHSIYLSILFDFGLVIFLFILGMIIYAIFKIFSVIKNLKNEYAKTLLISASGCIIVLGFSSSVDFTYNLPILWFLLGISYAIYKNAVTLCTNDSETPLRWSLKTGQYDKLRVNPKKGIDHEQETKTTHP